MKTNDYLLLTATGAYSFLFYDQNLGINLFLFNLIFLAALLIRNRDLFKSKKWWWSAGMCLISSACVFIHSSGLSIVANIFSLVLLAGISFNTATSSLFAFIFSGLSLATSIVYMVIDAIRRTQTKEEVNEPAKGYKIFAGLIVLFLTVLFFVMYKSANPLFAENTKWINLDFLSFSWIAFTIGGFILVYGLFYHKTIHAVESWENNLDINNKQANTTSNIKQYEAERFAGMLLFVMLNIMLLVLNIGDINTLYFLGSLPQGITHSDFVHNGVGVIIFSIIVATALIMYLFREEFNNVKYNTLFKALAYAWIIQNMIMLSSTAVRNQMYIHTYDFTYKRIGVYVWLLLAVIGLIIMFLKLKQERSNWYLIKNNVAVWFSVLVMSACFNWDKIITSYNLQNKPLSLVDFSYLFSLSEANIPQLITLSNTSEFKAFRLKEKTLRLEYYREQQRVYRDRTRSTFKLNFLQNQLARYNQFYSTDKSYNEMLSDKIINYLNEYESDWRSYDMRDREIINSIINRK